MEYGRIVQAKAEAAEREEQERFLLSDWRDCLDKLQDESVALVLTDPPYNIAHDRKVTRYNASDVSYDFGAWEAKPMSRRNMHFNQDGGLQIRNNYVFGATHVPPQHALQPQRLLR